MPLYLPAISIFVVLIALATAVAKVLAWLYKAEVVAISPTITVLTAALVMSAKLRTLPPLAELAAKTLEIAFIAAVRALSPALPPPEINAPKDCCKV